MDGGSMACDPNNSAIVYTGGWYFNGSTYVMAVSKSTDGGANWTRSQVSANYDMAYSLAIDRSNSNILYAGGMNSLYKSTDGGATWFASSTGLTGYVYDIAIGSAKANVLYAGTSGGVFKSTNAGASWTNTGCTNVNAVLINPANENEIYAATSDNGVYKSTTGGGGWTAINTGLLNLNTTSLGIYPNNYIYVSTYGNGMYRLNIMVGAEELKTDQAGAGISIMPNPSKGSIVICYQITQASDVKVAIYDAQGRLVKTILKAHYGLGSYRAGWDGTDDHGKHVASGIYFCRLDHGITTVTRPVIIVE